MRPYAKIEYTNLSLSYDYTICPLTDIWDNVECIKQEVEDVDEVGYKLWERHGCLPEIKISIVMMSDAEFDKWFTKNVKP